MATRVSPHLLAVLMLGVISQIGQVLFMRELLMVFHGNELSIGVILAAWLVWVGVGSHFGALFVERNPHPRAFLAVSSCILMLVMPATLLAMRLARGFFTAFPGAYLSIADMALACFLLMAPACILLGAQFVLLSRVWRESREREDSFGAEATYVGEAAGNMLGGVLFTFILVHQLTSLQNAVLAGVLLLIAVWLMLRPDSPLAPRVPGLATKAVPVLLVAGLAITPFLPALDDWAYQLQWSHFAPAHALIETHQSEHGAISIARRRDQYSFYQSGHLIFSTAGPETAVASLEDAEAADIAHLALVQHDHPRTVLLVGGGLRGILSEILEYEVQRIDYVELDETLTNAARPYVSIRTQEALRDDRVNLIHADGRLFVKTAQNEYDMIIVDRPDPFTAEMNRYYTREFFREAADLLRPNGVFVTGVTSTPDLRGTAIANRNSTIYHTLNSVFTEVIPAGDRFMFYFASNTQGQVSVDPQILEDRYRQRGVHAETFSPTRYHTLLEEGQLRRVNWMVRSHGRDADAHLVGPGATPAFPKSLDEQKQMEAELPPVQERYFTNTDLKPIGYYYTLMFWENLTRGDPIISLQELLHIQFWWVLPLMVFPLLIAVVLRARTKQIGGGSLSRLAVLLTVFTTGLSTMSLQVGLLFSFQSIYGFVYEMVGLVTAMFMCGLSLGAFLVHRYVDDKTNIESLARVQILMALLSVAIAIMLPGSTVVRLPAIVFVLFSMLTFMAGMINGIDFPLAVACYTSLHGRAERSTGTIYGTELFGACAGAIVASAVVAPIFGIIACCLLAAFASFTAAAVLLIARGAEYGYAR